MHLLTSGRSAFLEFLRNLTPQIMLIAFASVLSHRLDFSHFDLNNWADTVAFYVITLVSVMASYANTGQFMENASRSSIWIDKAALKVKRIVKTPKGRMYSLMRIVLKHRPSVFFELLIAALVLYAGIVIAANMAVASAITIIKASHA